MFCPICGERLIKVFKKAQENKDVSGVRCMNDNYVIWRNEPHAEYLDIDKDLIKLFMMKIGNKEYYLEFGESAK